jgi:trk system potassium uptake protein TrkA
LSPIWRDLFSRDHLPIDVIISPEIEVAKAVVRRLHVPGAFDTFPFADGKVQVIGVSLGEDCPVIETPLRQLTELFPDLNIVVVGVVRGDAMIVPVGDDQLLAGDEIYFVADTEHVPRAMGLFGHEEREARRVIIIGGGNIGLCLASFIEEEGAGVRAKVIELDTARAEFVADQLERTVVINGNALDRDILIEANAPQTETVVAVTDDDQVNILGSLLAKRNGCERALTLINNTGYGPLIASLGIDVALNPRATTVSSILQHVRRGRIRGVHSLRDGMAEVIEAQALETSSLVGTPLRDAGTPAGMIVGAVVRDQEIVIPRGDTVIEVGDRVIMFALADMVRHVEKMFSVRLDFF